MIKKIHYIKHLGVFEDYRVDSSLPDFTERNIIYGWNYSGKTTLSRLISYLDKDMSIDSDYSNLEFDVELDNGTHITHNNRASAICKTIVFNSDFIRDNLHFDSDDKIQGIKFAVGDVGTIHIQIKEIEKYIEKAKLIRDNHQTYIQQYSSIENGYTGVARQLTDILNLGRSFNRTSVSYVIDSFGDSPLESYILPSAKEEQVKINATSQNSGSVINMETIPNTKYDTLLGKVKTILERTPPPFKDDELLSSDNELYEWGKTGWRLYQQRPQLKKCAFCGGDISPNGRMEELNAYYTNEAARLKSDIETVKKEINDEIQAFTVLGWADKSDNDISVAYRLLYAKLKKEYQPILGNYAKLLKVLIGELDNKFNSALFTEKKICEIDDTANLKMLEWLSSVKQLFTDSNAAITGFSEIQTQAKEQYKKHYIAKYLVENQYTEVAFKKSREEYWCEKLNNAIDAKEIELRLLNDRLSSIDKGKEEINSFIKKFLNREDISIEVTEDKYFILKRDGKIAKHLSDGERTAIAFSHYMVMLKSLKDDNKLKDYIIFIDDPISSLDANHIAQVYSLITSFFFKKGLDPNLPEKICIFSNQLFIATHNFEFFSFINKAGVLKNKNLNRRFYITRMGNNSSTIKSMPKCYSDYNSEYVYLFSEINKAKEIKDHLNPGELFPEEKFYTLPNVIRRFLEIYTLIKLPGHKGEIDERVRELMGETNDLKILHNFSHFTSFERVTKHNELLSKLPDILDDVFVLLNKDPKHLKSLIEGITD